MKSIIHEPETAPAWLCKSLAGDCKHASTVLDQDLAVSSRCARVSAELMQGTSVAQVEGELAKQGQGCGRLVVEAVHLLPALLGCTPGEVLQMLLRTEDRLQCDVWITADSAALGMAGCASVWHASETGVVLRGLSTGRASDVTGTATTLAGQRTRYLLQKDGQVRFIC